MHNNNLCGTNGDSTNNIINHFSAIFFFSSYIRFSGEDTGACETHLTLNIIT